MLFCAVIVLVWIAMHTQNAAPPPQSAAPPVVASAAEQETPFDQMTAAQHLEKAKSILQGGILSLSQDQSKELDRHFAAIPKSAPESAEAKKLQKQAIEDAKEKYLERARAVYASKLEAQLQSQGFDITVTQLEDQLIVSCDLLKDDSGRLQFLSSIRNNRKDFCNMGFRRAVLSANGVFSGTHTYSLDCK